MRPESAEDPLITAWTRLLVRDFATAERLFKQVAQEEGDSARGLQAQAGRLLVRRHDTRKFKREESLAALEELLGRTPAQQRDLRALLLFQMALCWQPGVVDPPAEANRQREQAIPIYERIQREAPGTEFAAWACADQAKLLMTIDPDGNASRTLALLHGALERGDLPPEGQRMIYQALADQYRILGDWPEAERWLERWLGAGIETDWLLAQTLYSIAAINEKKLSRPEKALRYYERVAREFPFFNYASECHRRAVALRGRLGLPPSPPAPGAAPPAAERERP